MFIERNVFSCISKINSKIFRWQIRIQFRKNYLRKNYLHMFFHKTLFAKTNIIDDIAIIANR